MELLSDNKQEFPIQIIPQEKIIPESKNSLTLLGKADMILGQLPSMATEWAGVNQLSNAYKIVMPEGVVGELVQNSKLNNLLTTTIRGSNGRFSGVAGLENLAGALTPAAVASTAFSVASMIVGQYFLCQINKSIIKISESIEQIEMQIDTIQQSDVFAAGIFLKEIQNDWALILNSEDYRLAITTNILQTNNKLTSSIFYFENRLNVKLKELENVFNKTKPAEQTLLNEIVSTSEYMKLAYELRSCLKLISIYFTTGIKQTNSEEIKRTLKNDDDLLFSSTVQQLNKQIDNTIDILVHASTFKLQEQAALIRPYITNIRNVTRDRYNDAVKNNIDQTITRLKELDEKGCVFYIEDNNLYIENAEVA